MITVVNQDIPKRFIGSLMVDQMEILVVSKTILHKHKLVDLSKTFDTLMTIRVSNAGNFSNEEVQTLKRIL